MDQNLLKHFADDAIQVIQLAREESRRQGHNYVSTEQILLGLLLNEVGVASRELKRLGLTVTAVRQQIEVYSGQGAGLVAIEIPFTHRSYRVLYRSLAAAEQMNMREVYSQHLLLGLLREADIISTRILEAAGIDPVALEHRLMRLKPPSVQDSVLYRFEIYLTSHMDTLDLGSVTRPLSPFHLMTGDSLVADLVCSRHQSPHDALPDIVVEACSKSKPLLILQAKMQFWIAAGIKAGLILAPDLKQVHVYGPHRAVEVFQENDAFQLPWLLADFEIQGSALWSGLE